MAEMSTIVEGNVKYRDGKKWKPRWCVMKKPSPVADRLIVFLYKDVKDTIKGGNPKSHFPLDGFYGLESGICYDKETSVLAIICHKQITLLAFDSRETLIQFEIKIRRSLGEEHQFPVRTIKVPSHSKLPLDLLRMHIHGQKFCLTGHIPPKILASWQVSDLRRFGAIDGKFCFEGGSRCGKGEGCHVIQTDQLEEITEIIGHASAGKSAPLIKRQTSKRRSEFLDPVKQVVNEADFKKFQDRQVFADQNYHEDNSWPRYKRHSISFTDYRRTKTYADKQRLQSIENVEKERLMAIYDVPPRRIRKVESPQSSNNSSVSLRTQESSVRSFDVNFNALRNFGGQLNQDNENYLNWTGEFNNNVMSYQIPMTSQSVSQSETTTITSNQSDTTSSQGSVQSLHSIPTSQQTTSMSISSSAPVLNLFNKGAVFSSNYKDISHSVPNQIAEELDPHRDEVMRSLDQSQQDLEKEMSLLDEMLQICQRSEGVSDNERSQQPPPLPVKLAQLRSNDCRGNSTTEAQSPRGSLDNLSISSDNTHCRPFPRSGYSSSVLLSPNLVNKLQKIPKKSKLNEPLRYVNLSRYDGEVDTNHVHLPAASMSAPDSGHGSLCDLQRVRSKGYDNVRPERNSNKENKRASMSLPGSRENLRNIDSSDLQLSARVRNNSYSSEPIYANEPNESPPPDLPPKGPQLRSKQKMLMSSAGRPPAPPRLPERRQPKTRSQYSSPHIPPHAVPAHASQQEDYFMMGNFEREPTHCKIDYSDPNHRRNNSWSYGRQMVNLPPRDKNSTKMTVGDCYMDMTGIMELDKPQAVVEPESQKMPSRPRYGRSMSASGMVGSESPLLTPRTPARPESISVSAGNSPKEVRREPPIREENYMLMTTITPKRPVLENMKTLEEYVNTTQVNTSLRERDLNDLVQKRLTFSKEDSPNSSRLDDSSVCEDLELHNEPYNTGNIEMPFDNLLDFSQSVGKVAKMKNVQSSGNPSSEKTENSGGKTPGFFSRLMRRNSKDRKSVSQSHENLLSTTSSEPVIKEDVSVFVLSDTASSSGESSHTQSQQDLVLGPKDRSRSSSFPNRSSFISMNNDSNSSSSTGISILSQHSDLGATNSSLNSCETVSTHASSNEGNLHEGASINDSVLSDSEKEICKGNYDQQSYFLMGPLQDNSVEGVSSNLGERTGSGALDQTDENKMEEGNEKMKTDPNADKVFTVLTVHGAINTCKTDDEKLIDLWHSTHSLNLDKSDSLSDLKSKMSLPLEELSPDEKANAIARHISSLPPFVPPKMKSYPPKLSPVLERTSPKGDNKPSSLDLSPPTYSEVETMDSPVLSPSLMKQQAKAMLRITPPSEDEHGKIWIQRSATDEIKEATTTTSPAEKELLSTTPLVVDVSDLGESDSPSLSSVDSYQPPLWEDVVRSSPASTILRPRSGKEYQKVERRRTLDDSNTTSPLTTPQSPTGTSVFTFDNIANLSGGSSAQGDPQSPRLVKVPSSSEQGSICPSLRSDGVQSPRAMYMNIDFTENTPPESPLPVTAASQVQQVSPEQIEPELNYAEIDLSESGRVADNLANQARRLNYAEMDLTSAPVERKTSTLRSSKKAKKVLEQIPIEYSMIDMIATRAAQKARKEHAQDRGGSLGRERFTSLSSNTLSTKERVATLTKAERKQAAAFSAAQSTSSVDSTNI